MIGLQLLRKIIDDNLVIDFRRINTEILLDPSEKAGYEFIFNHLSTYGSLPSLETLTERGVILTEANEDYQYYYSQCVNRFKIQKYTQTGQSIVQAYRTQDGEALVSGIRQYLSECDSIRQDSRVTTSYEGMKAAIEMAYQVSIGTIPMGWDIGWDKINNACMGLKKGNLYSILGKTGVGKSWMLLNMMMQAAQKQDAKCLFVSMEMSDEDLWPRVLGMKYRIDPLKIQRGEINPAIYHDIMNKLEKYKDRDNMLSVSAKMKYRTQEVLSVIQEYKPDIAFIDSAYLMRPSKYRKGAEDRRNTISDVAEELKQACEELDIPIVASWQYGRSLKEGSKDASNDNIGETKIIADVSSMVIGVLDIQDNPDHRLITVTKNRFGQKVKPFLIKFDPMNADFSEAHDMPSMDVDDNDDSDLPLFS